MAKPELGTKRLCGGCSARFYDLGRNPIICPKCGAVFELAPTASPNPAPDKKPKPVETPDKAEAKKPEVEVISLEEADAEQGGGEEDIPDLGDEDVEDANTDIGGGSELIEDDEGDGDDMTDLVPKSSEDEA